MDLIHPTSAADVVEAVRRANDRGTRLLVVGGRRHVDRGNQVEVDAELWTTQLDRVIAYEPAEMVAVVEAGTRVQQLQRVLAEGGQEWPCDAPPDATVGGVLASGATSVRRLKVGALRETLLEAEAVTGAGRLIRSGARTVKNVTGYDLHKVLAGSLGTLGVLTRVALKVRPLPEARRTLVVGGGLGAAPTILAAAPSTASVLVGPERTEVRLEGWAAEVEELSAAVASAVEVEDAIDGGPFPSSRPWEDASVVAEVAVRPSCLDEALPPGGRWSALAGVGIAWVGLDGPGELRALRDRVRAAGGIAPIVRGRGGLGGDDLPAAAVQRRLKASFDPRGVLAPGRAWGGI